MKPAPFAYFDPRSVEEALDLLNQYGDDAKLLAGGQSLGPLLNMRMATPGVIIDLNRIEALDYQREQNGWLVLGALTRQSTLEDDPTLQERQPLVVETIPLIGHRAIRNRGTVGGSLVHADPAAEWPALVAAVEAELVVQRAREGLRVLSPEDFFLTYLTTSLEPDELLVEVRLPPWPERSGWAFVELSRRHGDFALAGVAARLTLDEAGICTDARLALIGVGPTPVRAYNAEALLNGSPPDEALFEAAANHAGEEIDPEGDLHASVDYRRHLATVLVGRALAIAAARVNGGGTDGST
ncbi:MAG: FAD binding domain-containing protein [Candidatus Bipolaricaulia bacterium]